MTDMAPQQPPTTRTFLAQKLERFRLAAVEIHTEIDQIERTIRHLRHDLVMVIAALDALEEAETTKKDAA